jgi:hypothetical protein
MSIGHVSHLTVVEGPICKVSALGDRKTVHDAPSLYCPQYMFAEKRQTSTPTEFGMHASLRSCLCAGFASLSRRRRMSETFVSRLDMRRCLPLNRCGS